MYRAFSSTPAQMEELQIISIDHFGNSTQFLEFLLAMAEQIKKN
jgi:hypothetical protein